VSYDRIDWHLDSAVEAGQPEEQAFTHIGLYLAWLIRHDLHDPGMFPRDHIDALKSGDMTGSDLADDIDGKLVADVMSGEGRAFSDARYEAYLGEYAALFDDVPEYGVVDGPDAYQRVEPVLDRLYAEWVDGGRQVPPPAEDEGIPDGDLPAMSTVLMAPPGLSQEEIDRLIADIPGDVEVMDADSIPKAHAAPALETLIPADLTSPPMDIDSVSAKSWGSSLLTRALRRLDVAAKDVAVVHAIGGEGPRTLTVSIYSVPGIDAARLIEEFRSVIFRIPGSEWEPRVIADREVQWAAAEEFTVAFWARDGMVVHVTGQPEVVVPAVSRLP
jgi:hypothetical protein